MHTFLKPFISMLLVAGLVSHAQASDWHYAFPSENYNQLYFFDKESITNEKGIKTLWISRVNSRKPGENGHWYIMLKTKIMCSNKTLTIVKEADYNEHGTVISTQNFKEEFNETYPDSIGSSLVTMVCNKNFPNKDDSKYFSLEGQSPFAWSMSTINAIDSKGK